MILGFDFSPRTRLIFGAGSVDRLGEVTRELDARRVLLVTDAGIVAAGHVERARQALAAAGIEVLLFDRVRENPTTRDVDACLAVANGAGIDAIIGLGGGSSIDTAKGCNFLLTNGGRMEDYWGEHRATKPMLPLVAVPTTAGTGSECQSYALIAQEETHRKMACGDPKAAPRVALLDPTLTLSQPREVTACTGIDALAHAVETAVTKRRNPLSTLYSREAFRLIANNLERVLEQPDDLEARAAMQLGAAYAGTAIELSMLGAAHAAANPLTARFGTVHGHAVGLMLPHVIRFNAEDPTARVTYGELASGVLGDQPGTVEGFAAWIASLVTTAFGAGVLQAPGDASSLAQEAAEQWTAGFNPRPITAGDFETLYGKVLA
jgi:alcohol dehydrogenase